MYSLGPAQLAVEVLDYGFIASVLDLRGSNHTHKILLDEFGIEQELKIIVLG